MLLYNPAIMLTQHQIYQAEIRVTWSEDIAFNHKTIRNNREPQAFESERCGGPPTKRPKHELVLSHLLGDQSAWFFMGHSALRAAPTPCQVSIQQPRNPLCPSWQMPPASATAQDGSHGNFCLLPLEMSRSWLAKTRKERQEDEQ